MTMIKWLLTTRSLSLCQMFVLSKTFVPYDQFDLDILFKVTAAIYFLNLADLNGATHPPQASNQVFWVYCCLQL